MGREVRHRSFAPKWVLGVQEVFPIEHKRGAGGGWWGLTETGYCWGAVRNPARVVNAKLLKSFLVCVTPLQRKFRRLCRVLGNRIE